MEEKSDDLSLCPSFNSYFSDRRADIAAKVGEEFRGDHKFSEDEARLVEISNEGLDDDGFEFALVRGDTEDSAAEIFYDGHVRPILPIFNRDLLINADHDGQDHEVKPDGDRNVLIPLKKLFMEEREERDPPSSSSSEVDELESVLPGTYCVWRPKFVEALQSRCKIKSNSIGSASKRWKFRYLLRRFNSGGKHSFVFLTPKNKEEKAEKTESSKEARNGGDAVEAAGEVKATKGVSGGEKASSAHEAFYVWNRSLKESGKRKSYLPYRPDLVGFFANVNGMGRSFPSF